MDWITQLFGRLHPLIVHFPIGILIVAFLLECLAAFKPFRKVRYAIQPILLLGAVSAIGSAFTGYFLSQEGGYDEALLERHEYLGIATAVFGVLVYLLRSVSWDFLRGKKNKRTFYIILFIPLIILISITGHFGGSLTHGEDYLFGIITGPLEVADPAIKLQDISNPDSARLYADIVEPILASRCYSCHSARKEKGELRLDGVVYIQRGGEHGSVLEPGMPDSSALFKRIMLPLEDEDHMPPNEKPQPSSSELAIIQAWIKEGASFQMKVAEYRDADKIKGYFYSLVDQSKREKLIPDEPVAAADEKDIQMLRDRNILVLPVSHESNYLSVNFVNQRFPGDKDLQLLLPLKKQIVWLNVGRTDITDAGLDIVTQLASLRRLNLEFTGITNGGLRKISSLSELHYLNLVGTAISDAGLKHLQSHKNLRQLFLYQTEVTEQGIKELKQIAPSIQMDTGEYQLPKMLTDSVVVKFNP